MRDEGLVRSIGTAALGVSIFNMVVGGGIFVLPGIIAALLGPAAIIAYVVCSFAVALIFLCYAEIGTRVTRSGGSYAYIEEAFGPFTGFLASWLMWFGYAVMADAGLIVAMTETLAIAFPILNESWPRAGFIIALLIMLVAVNVRGVKAGVRLYMFNAVAKLLPLLLLLVVGLFAVRPENFAFTNWPSLSDVGGATVILFFAFGGAETALNASGEIRDPARTVPKGLLLGIVGILCLYLGLQGVSQGVLGSNLANSTEAPLAATAQVVFGDWGATLLIVGSVISIYATISGDLLCSPRVVFAAARQGHLPSILGTVHPRFRSPHMAIMFFAALIALMALTGTFTLLAVISSGALLLVYAGVCLAVIRLRLRDGKPSNGEFALPLGFTIPTLACMVVGFLLLQLTATEALSLVGLLFIAAVLYGLRVWLLRR